MEYLWFLFLVPCLQSLLSSQRRDRNASGGLSAFISHLCINKEEPILKNF